MLPAASSPLPPPPRATRRYRGKLGAEGGESSGVALVSRRRAGVICERLRERTIPAIGPPELYRRDTRRVTSARYAPRCAYNTVLNAIKSLRSAGVYDGQMAVYLSRCKLAAYRAGSPRAARQTATSRSHSVCIQRMPARWKEKIEGVTARAKKKKRRKKKKNQFVSAIPKRGGYQSSAEPDFAARLRSLAENYIFPANMRDRGHARGANARVNPGRAWYPRVCGSVCRSRCENLA